MIAIFEAFLKGKWLWIVGISIWVFTFVLALLQARQTGKDVIKLESLKKTLDAVHEREKIKYNINGMSASKRDKLLKRWQRD